MSFDFHPHEFFLQMVSMGTRQSVGISHTHSLAGLANTFTRLALTGCLALEVKVAGSVWRMVPGTVLWGGVG